jgi:hypothetical protein
MTGPLLDDTEKWLAARRARITAAGSRAEGYAIARAGFRTKSGRHFDEIRRRLAEIAPAGSACFYCERDRYRDIDHLRPIRHFPEACFDWTNYVYACAICNQDAKQDRYAIITNDGELVVLDRNRPIDDPPPRGTHAVIDIRREDAFAFMALDLETGRFVSEATDATAARRADFTRELLRLDTDDLSRARRQARKAFKQYLSLYASAIGNGDAGTARRILEEILELPHPTVLAEMRRQSKALPELGPLFTGLPAQIGSRVALPKGTVTPAPSAR